MTTTTHLAALQDDAVTALKTVLADGKMHDWTEVIDTLADLLSLNRRDANHLANLAGRELNDTGEIVQRVEPGGAGRIGRLSASSPVYAVYSIPCPRCGAHEERPCWRMVDYGRRPGRMVREEGAPHSSATTV